MAGPQDWGAVPVAPVDETSAVGWGATPANIPWYLDVAKTAPASLGRGVVGAVTGIPTLADLAALGVEKGADYLGYPNVAAGAKAVQDTIAPATYGKVMNKIENVTGKWPEPETAAGKVVGTTLEIAPSLFTGATGVIPKLATQGSKLAGAGERMVRALAGGVGGTGAEYAADTVLPEEFKPIAKGIGGAVGVMAGPTAVRKMVTPLPSTAEHAADVKTLKDAGVTALTAGQKSGSPTLKQWESDFSKPKLEARDKSQFTGAVAAKSGMPEGTTQLTPQAFSAAETKFNTDLRDAVRTAEIKGTNFTDLQKDLANIRKTAYKDLRDEGIGKIDDLLAQIKGSPGALSIPGGRYNQLRQEVQKAFGDKSLTGTQRDYLGQIRARLDQAMGNEIPNLSQMQAGHANLSLLKGGAKNLDKDMQITPEGLKDTILDAKGWGSPAYTSGRGMSPLAQAGERVLPLPAQSEPSSFVKALSTGLGGLAGRNLGQSHVAGGSSGETLTGMIAGNMVSDIVQKLLRMPGRAAVMNPVSQGYLGNQIWKPGSTTTIDPAMAVKLLRSPYPGQMRTIGYPEAPMGYPYTQAQ